MSQTSRVRRLAGLIASLAVLSAMGCAARHAPGRELGSVAVTYSLPPPANVAGTGGIVGMVEDQAAISVPGALVTLSGPALVSGPKQREADADGAFWFTELARRGRTACSSRCQDSAPWRRPASTLPRAGPSK